jgi:hypothetical protein
MNMPGFVAEAPLYKDRSVFTQGLLRTYESVVFCDPCFWALLSQLHVPH